MSKEIDHETTIELEKLHKEISKLQSLTAQLEGRIASSWALHTREDYEKSFRENYKYDNYIFIAKCLFGVILFLAGAGYFFTKAVVREVYSTENKELIAKLESDNKQTVDRLEKKYQWNRFHNYGKNLIYVAESYLYLPEIDNAKRIELIRKLFDKSDRYFNDALFYDSKQASTYWELAELKYYYPQKFIVPLVDEDKAIENYRKAISYYTDEERKQGWKADGYFRLGEIYYKKIENSLNDKKQNIILAKENLLEAKKEYELFNVNSKENLEKINSNLQKLNAIKTEN
ncbi:MAG TPA: hypothetical protein VF648_04270 [Pyrinomonadaceae bacterium]